MLFDFITQAFNFLERKVHRRENNTPGFFEKIHISQNFFVLFIKENL